MAEVGKLYIVATPIGNMQDISARAVEVLSSVSLIAAEDTRHSKPLLARLQISTQLSTYHDHNEDYASSKYVEKLAAGHSIALISDAGTPLISDPGYRLVKAARAAGVEVLPVPGACALTAALSVSGLATDRFVFEGFLPAKEKAREQRFEALLNEERTMVFYESPHRIESWVTSCLAVFGEEREVFIGRELTKRFESHYFGKLSGALDWLLVDANNRRGEFVVILAGCPVGINTEVRQQEAQRIAEILVGELPLKQAVALAAEITGAKKNSLYASMLELKNAEES